MTAQKTHSPSQLLPGWSRNAAYKLSGEHRDVTIQKTVAYETTKLGCETSLYKIKFFSFKIHA